MCASIETYANEKADKQAVDLAIDICKSLNQSKEDTLKIIKLQCRHISEDFILERITLLWDNRTEE